MSRETFPGLDDWLEAHCLQIQTERPLHEAPFSFVELKSETRPYHRAGKLVLAWWKATGGTELFCEGKAHYRRVRSLAATLRDEWEMAVRLGRVQP